MIFTCTRSFTSSNGNHYRNGERLTVHEYKEIPFSEQDYFTSSDYEFDPKEEFEGRDPEHYNTD